MTHEETIENLRQQLAAARAVNAQAEAVRDENERLRASARAAKEALDAERREWARLVNAAVGARDAEYIASVGLVQETVGGVHALLDEFRAAQKGLNKRGVDLDSLGVWQP